MHWAPGQAQVGLPGGCCLQVTDEETRLQTSGELLGSRRRKRRSWGSRLGFVTSQPLDDHHDAVGGSETRPRFLSDVRPALVQHSAPPPNETNRIEPFPAALSPGGLWDSLPPSASPRLCAVLFYFVLIGSFGHISVSGGIPCPHLTVTPLVLSAQLA